MDFLESRPFVNWRQILTSVTQIGHDRPYSAIYQLPGHENW